MKYTLTLLIFLLSFTLFAQTECDETTVLVTIEMGAFPDEVDFDIFDPNGDHIFNFVEATQGMTYEGYYAFELCLADGCYAVNMYDSFGDGWNGAFLTVSYDQEMFPLGTLEEGDSGSTSFGVNDPNCIPVIPGCTDPTAMNFQPWATEDDGSCEYPFECEDGVAASLYICTFSNGGQVELELVTTGGTQLITVDNLGNGNIAYFEVCLPEDECILAIMSNNSGPNGWFNGYFWVNVGSVQVVTGGLPAGSQTETISFALNDELCPAYGCTDPEATNYDEDADEDDGSCLYPLECDDNHMLAVLEGGSFPGEISWVLSDENQSVIADGVGSQSSNTEFCIADGCYYLSMYDSFGDGWNGGNITFYLNGEEILNATVSEGDFAQATISVNSEDCETSEPPVPGCTDPEALNFDPNATADNGSCQYPLDCDDNHMYAVLDGGTFPYEISWEVVDEDFNVIASGNGNDSLNVEFCIPDGCYTLNMYDSFGDGWDVGSITLYLNDEELFTSTVEEGDFAQESVAVNAEGCEITVPPVPGCTDPEASNYNPNATSDDGSCQYPLECDDNLMLAVIDGGSFPQEIYWELTDENQSPVAGGTGNDSLNVEFCVPDGCYYLSMYDSFGDGWNGGSITFYLNGEEVLSTTLLSDSYGQATISVNSEDCETTIPPVYGCMDPEAVNYNPDATNDNGSCVYPAENDLCEDAIELVEGVQVVDNTGAVLNEGVWGECWAYGSGEGEQSSVWYTFTTPDEPSVIHIEAMYDSTYTFTDTQFGLFETCGGEMIYCDGNSGEGLMSAFHFNCDELELNTTYILMIDGYFGNSGTCLLSYEVTPGCDVIEGCTDAEANNYDPSATDDDGSCTYDILGCTDPNATNFDPNANIDDGSCIFPPCEENEVSVVIEAGAWGGEISWFLMDSDSTVAAFGGNYLSNESITEILCLEDGCYTLNLFDSFGDGWNGGSISFSLDGVTLLEATVEVDFNSFILSVNADCDEEEEGNGNVYGCTDPNANNFDPEANMDNGSCTYGAYEGPMSSFEGDDPDVYLYPVPVIDDATVDIFNGDGSEAMIINVFDMTGKMVYQKNFGYDQNRLRVRIESSQFSAGMYFVQVLNGDFNFTTRLIKQ